MLFLLLYFLDIYLYTTLFFSFILCVDAGLLVVFKYLNAIDIDDPFTVDEGGLLLLMIMGQHEIVLSCIHL